MNWQSKHMLGAIPVAKRNLASTLNQPMPPHQYTHTFILTNYANMKYYAFIMYLYHVSCKFKTVSFICVLHYFKEYANDSWLLKS